MNQLKQRITGKKFEQELKIKHGKIIINEISCDGCGTCIDICPFSALSMKTLSEEDVKNLPFKGRLKVKVKGNKKAVVNYDLCTTCGVCMKQCHELAIHKVRKN